MVLECYSLYWEFVRRTIDCSDSKKIWVYNGFTAGASLIYLIIYIIRLFYGGDIIWGAMHARVCHSSCACSRGSISLVGTQEDDQIRRTRKVEVYRAQPLSLYRGRVDLTSHRILLRDKPWSYSLA